MEKTYPLLGMICLAACSTTTPKPIEAAGIPVENTLALKLAAPEIDTAGLFLAPIQVTGFYASRPPASGFYNHDFKNLHISFRNQSKKIITSVHFKCYGKNAAGKIIDVGYPLISGTGNPLPNNKLLPQQSAAQNWIVTNEEIKLFLLACPVLVVFKDDSNWALNTAIEKTNGYAYY